jgi:hypothetical protein
MVISPARIGNEARPVLAAFGWRQDAFGQLFRGGYLKLPAKGSHWRFYDFPFLTAPER